MKNIKKLLTYIVNIFSKLASYLSDIFTRIGTFFKKIFFKTSPKSTPPQNASPAQQVATHPVASIDLPTPDKVVPNTSKNLKILPSIADIKKFFHNNTNPSIIKQPSTSPYIQEVSSEHLGYETGNVKEIQPKSVQYIEKEKNYTETTPLMSSAVIPSTETPHIEPVEPKPKNKRPYIDSINELFHKITSPTDLKQSSTMPAILEHQSTIQTTVISETENTFLHSIEEITRTDALTTTPDASFLKTQKTSEQHEENESLDVDNSDKVLKENPHNIFKASILSRRSALHYSRHFNSNDIHFEDEDTLDSSPEPIAPKASSTPQSGPTNASISFLSALTDSPLLKVGNQNAQKTTNLYDTAGSFSSNP